MAPMITSNPINNITAMGSSMLNRNSFTIKIEYSMMEMRYAWIVKLRKYAVETKSLSPNNGIDMSGCT
jgi:hypothetical protein